jgi:hypothetical protein
MHLIRNLKQRRLVLVYLAALSLLLLTVSRAAAFADTYFGSYNLSGSDPSYGPYNGGIWGSNIVNGGNQWIQAENWYIQWNSSVASNVRSRWDHIGPTFHVFIQGTTNCAGPFSYDGYYELSQADAYPAPKNATCYRGLTGVNNEVRIYWPASEVTSNDWYYGGAEFQYQTQYWNWNRNDKISNDIYFNGTTLGDEKKDNISITWCIDTNGGAWKC